MKKRILFIGVGNPVVPSSGMDVVLREHICELVQFEDFEVTGIIVNAGTRGKIIPSLDMPWPNFTGFTGDVQSQVSAFISALYKLAFILFSHMPLASYGFKCNAARERISCELNKSYDTIIIDHFFALCNFPLLKLIQYMPRMVLIAHDVTPLYLLESGRLKKNPLSKLMALCDAAKSILIETWLVRCSLFTAFLSQWDKNFYKVFNSTKTFAVCPNISQRDVVESSHNIDADKPYVIFIGSPSFFPNKAALEWIISALAPQLYQQNPDINIMLVGKGTSELDRSGSPNIQHMSFVSDKILSILLNQSLAMLCPVVHGGGIKIKVLEGIIAGVPILATDKSLRGFEFMNIQPMIKLDDPSIVVEQILAYAKDRDKQCMERARIKHLWSAYAFANRNKISNTLLQTLNKTQNAN